MRLARLAPMLLVAALVLQSVDARSAPLPACSPMPLGTFGSIGSGQGEFNNPQSVCVLPSGNVAVIDFYNSRGQLFTADGAFLTEWSIPNLPVAIDSDHLGRLFVITWYGHFYVYSEFGVLLNTWLPPQRDGYYLGRDVAVHGNEVYVAANSMTVTRFTLDGVYLGDIPTSLGLKGIAVASNGDLYASNEDDHQVCRYSVSGSLLGCWGSQGNGPQQFQTPAGMTVTPGGDLLVTDDYNDRISIWTGTGQFLCTWGTSGSGPGQFVFPFDIALGPDGTCYVAELGNDRIHKLGNIPTSIARRSWGQVKTLYR